MRACAAALLFVPLLCSGGCGEDSNVPARPSTPPARVAALISRVLRSDTGEDEAIRESAKLLFWFPLPHSGREKGPQPSPSEAGNLSLWEALHELADVETRALDPLREKIPMAGRGQRVLLERVLASSARPAPEIALRFEKGDILQGARSLRTSEASALAQWLCDARPEVRRAASGGILLASMVSVATQTDTGSRRTLRENLGRDLLRALPALAKAAEDTDPTTRARASLALTVARRLQGLPRDRQTRDRARECLEDEDPFIRQSAALQEFIRSKDSRPIEILVTTMDEAWFGRRQISGLLMFKPETVAACKKLLGYPEAGTREKAAIILTLLEDRGVPESREALQTAQEPIREAGRRALEEMRPWGEIKPETKASIEDSVDAILGELRFLAE